MTWEFRSSWMSFNLTESEWRTREQRTNFTSSNLARRASPQNQQSHLTGSTSRQPKSQFLGIFRKSLHIQLPRAGASRVCQAWSLPVKLLNLPSLWSLRGPWLGFKTGCCGENSSALLVLLLQSLWLQAPDNHTVVYTANPTTTTRDSSFKEISEAKAKNLWLLPYNAFGQFLHTKLKTQLKTLQHSQVPVTPVHQTQTSDTDWAHSITTSLMPGLAGLSIYFSLTFPSSPQHTAGSPAP